MAGAKIFPVGYLLIFLQICSRRQCEANTLPQQTAQHNVVNTQNLNQNADLSNFNAQKQAMGQQQNLNLQQFASIPVQTFNVQQPATSQQQGHSQQATYQAVNQALNLQAPHHYNLQQEVNMNSQQVIPSVVNLQQATVVPVNSQQSTVHTSPQAVIVQQPPPVQGLNLQQQAYPQNLPQSQAPAIKFQPALPLSTSLQQAVAQPVKMQQQTTQQSVLPTANSQTQGATQMGNFQKAAQTTVNSQQPSVVQKVTYQQPIQQNDPIGVTQLNVHQPQILQQMPPQQIDFQQQNPCNSRGNYQVISYQKPCQLSEATPTQPMTLPLSLNPNPTVVAAIPGTITIQSTAPQTDQIYVLSPQNYLTSTSYSPRIVTDTLQSALSGPTIQVPIITVPNSAVSSTNSNFATNNCNQQFETENWTWSQKIPDIGMLSDLQFPIASLLGQPTSSVQSALLSSILSSIQGPVTPPQYIISSSYPTQTIVSPQSSSQSSKLSLKSLLPLLLNMLQEKYTNSGCQCCNCCNCECSNNRNVLQVNTGNNEPNVATEIPTEEEENVSETIQDDESAEIEDDPVGERKRPNNKENIIPYDSAEIDDVENSSCIDEESEDDPVDESDETNSNI